MSLTDSEYVSHIESRIDGSIAAISAVRERAAELAQMSDSIRNRLRAGGTIYTAGNGGSAAEALHLAEELVGRYRAVREPIAAACLNADPTALTCIANDYGFDAIFARQCSALVRDGDILILFSTSGNSGNLIAALDAVDGRDVLTIGLLGKDGGACASRCNTSFIVPSDDSAHIQEAHQVIMHIICEMLDDPNAA